MFRKYSGKRPNFLILLPNIGCIFVDIKYKEISKKYDSYPLDEMETKDYSSFQRKYNIPVWYVISNKDFGFKTWLWVPISKVLEKGISERVSSKSGEKFFPIPAGDFIQLSENDGLDRLFSKLFN